LFGVKLNSNNAVVVDIASVTFDDLVALAPLAGSTWLLS
jgi:hypothetical protein